ncbi:MAG: tetratricopeptide repeat protein, partial [Candidatus Krumholzibacteriota bacterium]
MLRKYIFPALFVLILLSCFHQARAGENEDFSFAEKLRRDKMFVAAAEEYIRFCDRYPESALCPGALFLAGESWMQAGRAEKALETFQSYLNKYPGAEEVCKARFYRGRIMKKLEMYAEAASEFLMVNDEYPGCALAGRSLLEAGESLLKAGNPEEASLILKKLIKVTGNEDLIPVAKYSLALALINMDRELEACRELETITEKYPDSPLAGMALLKLGKDAASSGRTDRAEEYFSRILETRQEENLREKGIFNLILLYSETGNPEQVLEKSRRYLSIFEDGERRIDVYRFAIRASGLRENGEKALGLIDRYRTEYPQADSTGWTYAMKARIQGERGKTDEALKELEKMSDRYPGAVYSPEILLLRAELNSRKGRYPESARFYRMALSEGLEPGLKGKALAELARLYISELNDTLAAAGLWEEAASYAAPELREKALFNAAGIRESAGDLDGAAALYRKVIEEFPGGEREAEAGRRLELINLRPKADRDFAGSVHRLLLGEEVPGSLLIDAAGTYLDYSLIDQALAMLEEAASRELSGEDAARLEFYLGKAYSDRYKRSLPGGEKREDDLEKALSHWRTGANRYSGTSWGEKSYRSYLERKLESWDLSRRLSGLDKYMEYYGSRESSIWALKKKAGYLFAAAESGAGWAADSALAACRQWGALSPPECDMAEITRKRAYIYERKGDDARAASLLSEYTGKFPSCGCDPQAGYDLGELRIKLKQYGKAKEAFQYCLDCGAGGMRVNCRLRKGDCHFYLKDYSGAEEEYSSVSERSPGSQAAAVADFRRALALEKMGKGEKADSVYIALLEKENAGSSIRARAMEKLGRKNLQAGNYSRAEEYFSELVRMTGSPDNRIVYAEILLKQGDYGEAEKLFSGALRYEETDSLRILAGRAVAR